MSYADTSVLSKTLPIQGSKAIWFEKPEKIYHLPLYGVSLVAPIGLAHLTGATVQKIIDLFNKLVGKDSRLHISDKNAYFTKKIAQIVGSVFGLYLAINMHKHYWANKKNIAQLKDSIAGTVNTFMSISQYINADILAKIPPRTFKTSFYKKIEASFFW